MDISIPVELQRLIQDITPDIRVGDDVILPEEWVFAIVFFVTLAVVVAWLEERYGKRKAPGPHGAGEE